MKLTVLTLLLALPAINLVQNGYLSIVAYQIRGYALLPMD